MITKKQLKKIVKEEYSQLLRRKLNEVDDNDELHAFDADIYRQVEYEGNVLDVIDKIYMDLMAMGESSLGMKVNDIMGSGNPDDQVEQVLQIIPTDVKDVLAPVAQVYGRKGLGGAQAAHDRLKRESRNKRQLKKIIKEEKAKILKEFGYRHPQTGEDLFLMLNDVVDKLLDQGIDTIELANELRGLADDVEDSAPMTYDK